MMKIFPPQDLAARLCMSERGLIVLDSTVLWARRDRFAYCIEAFIDTEIAFKTAQGWVLSRRKMLVSTPIDRIGGTRARLTRQAALLTAAMSATPQPQQVDPQPLAA